MIEAFTYSAKEIDLIYSAVEEAVAEKKQIDMLKICDYVKPGDFYLNGLATNGFVFTFMGLKWIQDGEIYTCLIQPHIQYGDILVGWYPVITVNDRTHTSSGRLNMIKKENRYIDTSVNWVVRELR